MGAPPPCHCYDFPAAHLWGFLPTLMRDSSLGKHVLDKPQEMNRPGCLHPVTLALPHTEREEQMWARVGLSPRVRTPGVEVGKYSRPAGVEQREHRNTALGWEEAGQGAAARCLERLDTKAGPNPKAVSLGAGSPPDSASRERKTPRLCGGELHFQSPMGNWDCLPPGARIRPWALWV